MRARNQLKNDNKNPGPAHYTNTDGNIRDKSPSWK